MHAKLFSFFTNYGTFLLSNETKFNINKIWEKNIFLHDLVEGLIKLTSNIKKANNSRANKSMIPIKIITYKAKGA